MNNDKHINYQSAQSVTQAVNTRRALRAFTSQMPPEGLVTEILKTAGRAPSGTNIQPWKVYVVTGETRDRLCAATCKAFDDPSEKHLIEVPYYPEKWFEPYLARRRKVGWDLYGLLGIKKGDHAKTHEQHKRNFQLFDAPVCLMFTVHRDLSTGSWLDYGMFLQNIMLLAREAGLHTCPQAAWSDYHRVVRAELSIDDSEVIVCGMALGYADESALVNQLVADRIDVSEFVQYLD